jgi:hypothetical protein
MKHSQLKKLIREELEKIKEDGIRGHHIEFFDKLAEELGWDDFDHMEKNSDEIPDYAKKLFNMVCELSGKYPPFQ